MDLFIESLDRNRMYLLKGDVEFFDTYRFQLDDMVRSRPLDPVFEMYQVYQTRWKGRTPFQDEADSGVVEAMTRLVVTGRARGGGSLHEECGSENWPG